ncbi:MAG: hypothetical protein IKA32_02785 [Lentisphaeria bacterium]|nr:hypothetical protein [Lentisphaeria bacterium]
MFKGDNILKTVMAVLLGVVSFFVTQTYYSIKSLEKDVVTIRVKLAEFEAARVTRQEIRELIAEYHESHPYKNKE